MSDYRRAYRPGGHYFFTLVTYNRFKRFSDPQEIDRLRGAFRHVKAQQVAEQAPVAEVDPRFKDKDVVDPRFVDPA